MTPPHGQRLFVAALAVLNTVAYGTLYYAQPLLAVQFEQAHHWPRSFTSLAFTLALLVTAFSAPALGKLFDAGRGLLLLTAGAGLGAVAFALLASSNSPALFVFAWLLAGVAMALTFYEATFAVLAGRIGGKARTRATLSITLVAGLASTIFVPLVTVLLERIGLTGSLWTISAMLALCAALLWRFVPPSTQRQERVQATSISMDPFLRRVTLVFTLSRIVMVGVGLQLVPMLLHDGLSAGTAAAVAGLLGAAALPGRVMFVPALERWGVKRMTAFLTWVLLLATGLLVLPHHLPLLPIAAMLFGLANGALTLARPELLHAHYPANVFGSVNGKLAWWVNLAQAMTPFAMGWLFTSTGTYLPAVALLTALAFVAALAMTRFDHGLSERTEPSHA
ncbi:MFS transporter [Deinococcus sp.]|uniref:MFS transporter n=1 Tax=Deinococcus sp. TaxID=47478 RepID=UPI0025B9E76F|nr:MFS transporter [Deinococcus sp.]